MGVKVLSVFDGMSCGMIAMQSAGMEVESYDAYEIDKYAVKTAQHNFPMIKERGDVFLADFTQYKGVDFLIGGSPCTYWSIAQTKNRETVASGMGWELFSQYVRALHEAKPKYFIYENNKSMSKDIRASIDEAFGFEAVLINSALVSAQNRQRLYWVGKRNPDGTYSQVPVEQPEDRGILLRDILEDGIVWQGKSYTLTTRCCGAIPEDTMKRHRHTMVAEPIEPRCVAQRGRYPENPKSRVAGLPAEQMFEAREDGKTNTLTTVQKDNLVAEPVNITRDGKAQCLRATYYKVGIRDMVGNTVDRKTCVAEPIRVGTYPTSDGRLLNSQGNRIYSVDGKAVTQSAQGGGWGAKTGLYATPVRVGDMPSAEGKICGSQSKRIYSIDGKAPSICATETGGNSDTSSPATRLYDEPVGIKHLGSLYGQHSRWGVFDEEGKAPTLTASAGMGGGHLPMVKEPVKVGYVGYAIEFDDEGKPIKAIGKDGKEITLYEVRNGLITIKGKQYPIKLKDGYYIIRKLTVRECMRLQTVPEWYEFPVSDSQAYKMLGNGWTVDVIAHILKGLKEA